MVWLEIRDSRGYKVSKRGRGWIWVGSSGCGGSWWRVRGEGGLGGYENYLKIYGGVPNLLILIWRGIKFFMSFS